MSFPWPYNMWTKSNYILIKISKADGEGEEFNEDKYGSSPSYPLRNYQKCSSILFFDGKGSFMLTKH